MVFLVDFEQVNVSWKSGCLKTLITFLSYFLICITYCQHTIVIYYAHFTGNILISSEQPLYKLKHFASSRCLPD